MRRLQSLVTIILSLFLLVSCAKSFQLIRFSDGLTIEGAANLVSKTLTLTMPDGEVMEGRYAAVSDATFSTGFATGTFTAGRAVGTATSTAYGFSAGGHGNGYALLKGNRGRVMECVFQFNPMNNHGFGEARTNKGEAFKMIF